MLQTSQIIIDDITQFSNYTPGGATFTISHRVSSQDAVVVIFVDHDFANLTSLSFNGQTITRTGQSTPSASAFNSLYYIRTPPVGNIDITVVVAAGSNFLGFIAISALGVNKKMLNPRIFSTTSAAQASSINLPLPPLPAGSLVIDSYAVNYNGLPVTFVATQEWQKEIANESAPVATMAALNVSYSEGSPSARNIGWTLPSGNVTAVAGAMIAVCLEAANTQSMWFPSIDARKLGDTVLHNADAGFGSPLSFSDGYKPSLFFKNSFLHTVGRIKPIASEVALPPATVYAGWRSMMGMGY